METLIGLVLAYIGLRYGVLPLIAAIHQMFETEEKATKTEAVEDTKRAELKARIADFNRRFGSN